MNPSQAGGKNLPSAELPVVFRGDMVKHNNYIMNIIRDDFTIKTAIVETLVFFDLFDYPLTAEEIRKYLCVSADQDEISTVLAGAYFQKLIARQDGFYFLAGREKIIADKKRRQAYFLRKAKKAKRISFLFRIIPWIKTIAIGNIIGSGNLRDEGDIDLFIITDRKRIWLSRFFCVAIIKFLGLRPRQGNMRDKICLSFFISEDHLDIRDLNLDDDIYFAHWLAGLYPISDKDDMFRRFLSANAWIDERFPNFAFFPKQNGFLLFDENIQAETERVSTGLGRQARIDKTTFFDRCERFFWNFQLKIMPAGLRNILNKNTCAMANDAIIKLHANDRRAEYRDKWKKKTGQFLK